MAKYMLALTRSIVCIFIQIQIFLIDQCVGDFAVLSVDADDISSDSNTFCMTYDPGYHRLPPQRYEAPRMQLRNLMSETYKKLCNPSTTLPAFVNGSAVAVSRGNCTFSQKALVAQQYGSQAIIVVSNVLSGMTANTSEEYNDINITVAMITADSFTQIQSIGSNITVQMYAPTSSTADLNLLVIWTVAVLTVVLGSLWSGTVKYQLWLSGRCPSTTSRRRQSSSDVELTPLVIVIAVVFMCAFLLGLYFFYRYLVYVIIVLFVIAASLALHECLSTLFHLLPLADKYRCRLPENNIPLLRQRPYIADILLLILSTGIGIVWLVFRHYSYAWILQDFLGVVFCIQMMKSIRLPNLMTCTILLVLLFLYDIFFVFITPLLTKDGHSVMIDVAAGGGNGQVSGEALPMVIIVPRILQSEATVCLRPYSLLGFGDILVPGLLVSFCCGFGFQVRAVPVYFFSTVLAYGVGLLVTFAALALMGTGQPALLYIVPLTLGTAVVIGWCRGELRALWTGRPVGSDLGSANCVTVSTATPGVNEVQSKDDAASQRLSEEEQRLID